MNVEEITRRLVRASVVNDDDNDYTVKTVGRIRRAELFVRDAIASKVPADLILAAVEGCGDDDNVETFNCLVDEYIVQRRADHVELATDCMKCVGDLSLEEQLACCEVLYCDQTLDDGHFEMLRAAWIRLHEEGKLKVATLARRIAA